MKIRALALVCGLAGGMVVGGWPAGSVVWARTASATPAIGSAMPALPAVKWLKGEAVKEWKAGEVYVLDFWATWCRPCIVGIPHLIELQEKYREKKVHVIGLAVWPREGQRPTDKFVEQFKTPEGKGINYLVAEEVDGSVTNAYLSPLGINGIPTMAIIDRQGRLAWVGHPMDGADEVLGQVVEGTYDVEKAAAAAREREQAEAKIRPVMMEFHRAQMAGEWPALIAAADRLIALDARQFAQAGLYKYFVLLTKIADKEKAASVGRELVNGLFAENAMLLSGLAHLIVESEEIKDEDQDLELALSAAQKAETLDNGNRAVVYNTLARVRFERKELAEAVAAQEKAVSLAGNDEELKADLEKTLAEYRAAKAKE